MSKTNGGPAFPALCQSVNGVPLAPGMTLRDYFAAKAMQGICACGPGNHMTNEMISIESYALADAMLKARNS